VSEVTPASGASGRAVIAVVLTLACALLVGAAAWHVRAESAYRSSLADGRQLGSRYADAYTAAALEPWNVTYAQRDRLVAAWLRADTLLAKGDYKGAVALLSVTPGRTPAEPDLLALYRKAQAVQSLETNRKAHLQHAHEGPGGTLRPTDVER
jgi:hypothetical protein